MGKLLMHKYGYNPDVDAVTLGEDIIAEGGLQYWATSAAILQVTSTSTDDALAGVGARALYVEGVGADFSNQYENIPLNGTTTVNSKFKYLRVNRAYIVEAGSSETNVGDVTISDGVGVMAFILAGFGQTAKSTYTVPKGYSNLSIVRIRASLIVKQSRYATGMLLTRHNGSGWRVRHMFAFETSSAYDSDIASGGLEIHARDDVRIHIDDASVDSLPIAVSFDISYGNIDT